MDVFASGKNTAEKSSSSDSVKSEPAGMQVTAIKDQKRCGDTNERTTDGRAR
jgi:hypothetical protein